MTGTSALLFGRLLSEASSCFLQQDKGIHRRGSPAATEEHQSYEWFQQHFGSIYVLSIAQGKNLSVALEQTSLYRRFSICSVVRVSESIPSQNV